MSTVRRKEIERFQRSLDRALFMPERKDLAEVDAAFPIGYGQTISQPSLVAYMTAVLEIQERKSRVLEIGTGSGYQTALLAAFAAQVYTVERIPQLLDAARIRLEGLGYENISFHLGDGVNGWPEEAPFDRIMVTASAGHIPVSLLAQLSVGGIMVIPVGDRLMRITREGEEVYREEDLLGVRFVPFVGTHD